MAFNTYNEGLKIASNIAGRAIATESSLSTLSPLASPLPLLHKAFQLYVSAAEAYSHLLASSYVSAADRPQVQKKWRLVLERAEKVKRRIEELGGRVGTAAVDEEAGEAAVCRRGANMNGIVADIWRASPPDRDFQGETYRDSFHLELAEEQLANDPEWAELPASAWEQDDGSTAWEVKQGPGADCSVTAGLGACLAHNQRWGTSLARDALYPQAVSGRPRRSENAKHVVKLLLNGAWRGVVLDSLLPRSRTTHKPLHITSRRIGSEENASGPAWIPVAVKGYFKSQGGYSIPGSDPAPDVYAFTGWIPERLDLESGFQREKEWSRLILAWNKGSVIVTLGSGREVTPGLVPLHAYGVVDISEIDGERVLRIFDPGSSKLRLNASDLNERLSQVRLRAGDPRDTFSFTMTWDEVCSKFDTLNLNWNPSLLPVTAVKHWCWPKPDSSEDRKNPTSSLHANPRYRVVANASKPDSELWLLLSQHRSSKDQPLDDVALHVFRDHRGQGGASRGKLLCNSQEEVNPYANALHSLVRFPLRQGENALNAITSRDHGMSQTGFTLQAFATEGTALSLERVSLSLPFSETVTAALTKRSAGGHPGYPTHHLNPQYRLAVSPPTPGTRGAKTSTLRFSLQGAKELAWNVNLLWGQGERVFELSSEIIVTSSGPFSYGTAYCEAEDIEPGNYTVVVSSYEREKLGPFELHVECSAPITVAPIPQEGAGMFHRSVAGRWDSKTAGGRPSGNLYSRNPRVEITVSTPTTLMSRLYLPRPGPIPINLTVFKRAAGGDLGEQVATSGPYVERIAGVTVARVKVPAGVYVFVPSTYETGAVAQWVVDVWGDAAFSAEVV